MLYYGMALSRYRSLFFLTLNFIECSPFVGELYFHFFRVVFLLVSFTSFVRCSLFIGELYFFVECNLLLAHLLCFVSLVSCIIFVACRISAGEFVLSLLSTAFLLMSCTSFHYPHAYTW